jgi:hypothetical protein
VFILRPDREPEDIFGYDEVSLHKPAEERQRAARSLFTGSPSMDRTVEAVAHNSVPQAPDKAQPRDGIELVLEIDIEGILALSIEDIVPFGPDYLSRGPSLSCTSGRNRRILCRRSKQMAFQRALER